ncbi:MAG TPA: PD-(D/E)XK nuclease family protein [Candidatus Paceibacterota bacterium]|nr:PD-(D/E)XK nuclease family protein [Candidatus Paceibacterota bacterium]
MATFTKKYNPNRNSDWNYGGPKWRLSRSKIDLYIECPRCFYLDNKLGTARPRGPAFTLNVAVDELFKKEFDVHRKNETQHPIMQAYGVHARPFAHPELPVWRDNFLGLEHKHDNTGFTVSGAVDDIWVNDTGKLIVVDYKATSKEGSIETLADSSWEEQYRRQIGVYQWLLMKNGFDVEKTGYFVYANARTDYDSFDDTLHFKTTLVPCEGDYLWIEQTLSDIKSCLECDIFPKVGESCEFCPYREAAGKKLQKIYAQRKK